MSDMFECHDCGHAGEALPKSTQEPWHKCTNCNSGFVSRMDIGQKMDSSARSMSDMRERGFNTASANINNRGDAEVTLRHGNWLGRYSGGHIHIAHANNPDKEVDMINNYDYGTGSFKPLTSRQAFKALSDWASFAGEDTFRQINPE